MTGFAPEPYAPRAGAAGTVSPSDKLPLALRALTVVGLCVASWVPILLLLLA